MFSFYRLVEEMDRLEEYKWEKDVPASLKTNAAFKRDVQNAKEQTRNVRAARKTGTKLTGSSAWPTKYRDQRTINNLMREPQWRNK